MLRKFWLVLAALVAVGVLMFVAGCQEDSEDTTNNGALTVTAPAAGDNWTVGTVHNITWTESNVSAVDIAYSTDGGTNWNGLATAVNNTHSYSWTVPNHPSANCVVGIRSNGDTTVSDLSGVFTIALPPLVATWQGTALTIAPMGLDSLHVNMGLDSTFIGRMKAGTTEIVSSGTYVADPDTVHFHTTVYDGQPVNETAHSWYALTQNNTRLQMEVLAEGSQGQDSTYLVTFTKQ